MRRAVFWRGLVVGLLILGFLAGPVQAQETKAVYTLRADGLACPFCAYGIEKQLNGIEGVVAVGTEIKTGTVSITRQDGITLDEQAAKAAVEKAGCTMGDFKQPGANR